jgi:hypothetical protein
MADRLQAGETVWIVPNDSRRGKPYRVSITKVGRLYATTHRKQRINLESNYVMSGDYAVGTAYRDLTDYERNCELERLWSALYRRVNGAYRRPAHINADDISEIEAKIFPI